jgi:hypothetical protein
MTEPEALMIGIKSLEGRRPGAVVMDARGAGIESKFNDRRYINVRE